MCAIAARQGFRVRAVFTPLRPKSMCSPSLVTVPVTCQSDRMDVTVLLPGRAFLKSAQHQNNDTSLQHCMCDLASHVSTMFHMIGLYLHITY